MMSIATSAGIALSGLGLIIAVWPIEAPRQPAVHVPRPVLAKYVGEYVYPDGTAFRVRLVGDTLFQEAPGRRLAYAPLSETLFKLGSLFTAEFVTDEAGGATQILSNGKGIEFRLRRKGAPPAAASHAPAGAARGGMF